MISNRLFDSPSFSLSLYLSLSFRETENNLEQSGSAAATAMSDSAAAPLGLEPSTRSLSSLYNERRYVDDVELANYARIVADVSQTKRKTPTQKEIINDYLNTWLF